MARRRERLPERREGETFSFEHWCRPWSVTVGLYPDGRVGEVFMQSGKSGEQMETLAHDAAVIMSIALQYGAPLEVLAGAITRTASGAPMGPFGALLDLLSEPGRSPRQQRGSASGEDKRRAGIAGGHARAQSLSTERRREIARAAAKARWDKGDESLPGFTP
jgi:hypothetical protein